MTMLGQYDCEVVDYIGSLHAAGVIVSRSITIASAKTLISQNDTAIGGPSA